MLDFKKKFQKILGEFCDSPLFLHLLTPGVSSPPAAISASDIISSQSTKMHFYVTHMIHYTIQ